MANLTPAPSELGFASPALGPWFTADSGTLPLLGLPNGDLSVSLQLPVNMEWRAPATCTCAYTIATHRRPSLLRGMRQANGTAAFDDNSVVVVLTLLPEVEQRLWALTQAIPSPDGSAVAGVDAPVNSPARPRIRWFAIEVSEDNVNGFDDVEGLFPLNIPSSVSASADKAAYMGLSLGDELGNADTTAPFLRQPNSDRALSVALKNTLSRAIDIKLWCFDARGRAIDPGAVANWYGFMASSGVWDNLWFDGNPQTVDVPASDGRQRLPTVDVTSGRIVHITNAHEGPLDSQVAARIQLQGLTAIASDANLYTSGNNPSLEVADAPAAPAVDVLPIPRIAALPLGTYVSPADSTPFAGWSDSEFPQILARDFLRIAVLDVERHTIGLDRSDAAQANPRYRLAPAPNTASPAVLASGEDVTAAVMSAMAGGESAQFMTPVLDSLWGAVTPPVLGSGALPEALRPESLALAGEGQQSEGGSVSNQTIALHFQAGSLPANVWVRIWPHGMHPETGARIRLNGGAGLSDASGEAYIIIALPDGVGGASAPDSDAVTLSYDALVSNEQGSIEFVNQRFRRPPVVEGTRLDMAAAPVTVRFWVPELGGEFTANSGQFQSGQQVLALTEGAATALVDLTTLRPEDMNPATLQNAVQGAATRVVITEPAFNAVPDGNISTLPNGAVLKKLSRSPTDTLQTMGRPAPAQERRELVAYNRPTGLGVVGSVPSRERFHSTPELQTGHVGMPASSEIRGPGVALEGPAAHLLAPLMRERISEDLASFVRSAGTPDDVPNDTINGPVTWTAVLETMSFGVAGESIIRATAAGDIIEPGARWQRIKAAIETAASIGDLDSIIDTTSFDDDLLADAVDVLIRKTREGVTSLATSLLDAISRAEDFIYIETPVIDELTADNASINVIESITERLAQRPNLHVILCIPEAYLPTQAKKLESIRKSLVGAALLRLKNAAGDRIVLFSPIAGIRRKGHLSTTTIIVDDVILYSGTTHLWRRGLTFDSSIAVALFDENTKDGRPLAVHDARIQFMASALNVPVSFIPECPVECVAAIHELNRKGGGRRVKAGSYPPKADASSADDLALWNPDGTPNANRNWLTLLSELMGGSRSEFDSALR